MSNNVRDFSPTNLLCAIQAKMFEDFTPREAQTDIPGYLCKNIYSNCPSEWVIYADYGLP